VKHKTASKEPREKKKSYQVKHETGFKFHIFSDNGIPRPDLFPIVLTSEKCT